MKKVVRFVDAMTSQRRFIIWLECHHKVSITEKQHEANPGLVFDIQVQGKMVCPFCPPPAADEGEDPVKPQSTRQAPRGYNGDGYGWGV